MKYTAEDVRQATRSITPDPMVIEAAWRERNERGEGDDLGFAEDVFPDVDEFLTHLPDDADYVGEFAELDVFDAGAGVVIVGYGAHGVWAQWVNEE